MRVTGRLAPSAWGRDEESSQDRDFNIAAWSEDGLDLFENNQKRKAALVVWGLRAGVAARRPLTSWAFLADS